MPRSCEAAHEDSKVEEQRGGEIHHIATDHGPMVQGGLLTAHPGSVHGYGWFPGGVSPSGRVPEQLLQAAPILKQRRRWNREGFAKKGSVLGVSTPRGKYRRRGASRGPTRKPGGLLARPRVGPRQGPSWSLVVPPFASLDDSERFRHADFVYIFPGIF